MPGDLGNLPGAGLNPAINRRIPMTSMSPNISDAMSELRSHWKLFLFQGIVMIILGILAVVAPAIATVAVDVYFGWLFLFSGFAGIIAMFSAGSVSSFLWMLVTALLSIVVGGLLIWRPVEGAASLTFLLTAFFLVEGIFQIAGSFTYRDLFPSSWGWLLVSGICDLLLAGVIIWTLPSSAMWALGLIVGINLITSGNAVVMTAIAARNSN
jgi:uncharacterized membrane protein HdeD (DUF308 family)